MLVSRAFACLVLFQKVAAFVDQPDFPHLEPRFEALNITNDGEVRELVKDWEAELEKHERRAGSMTKQNFHDTDVLNVLLGRATCPVGEELCVIIATQQPLGCCITGATCCATGCCNTVDYSCCSSIQCCAPGFFCCSSESCCVNGASCSNGICLSPTTTLTATSYTTKFSTITTTIDSVFTSTIQSTIEQTSVVIDSTVATATITVFNTQTTTITQAAVKRAANATPAPAPRVNVAKNPKLDILAQKLEKRGLLLDRDVVTTTIFSTVDSIYTSTVFQGSTAYVTDFVTNVVISTSFINAKTSTTVTSITILTITMTSGSGSTTNTPKPGPNSGSTTTTPTSSSGSAVAASSSSSSTSPPKPSLPKPSLSPGAKAGIGIGSVVGAALLGTLLFLLFACLRKRRNEENNPPEMSQGPAKAPPPAAPIEYYPPVDSGKYPANATATEMGFVAANSQRGSTQPSSEPTATVSRTTSPALSGQGQGQRSPTRPPQNMNQGARAGGYPVATYPAGYTNYPPPQPQQQPTELQTSAIIQHPQELYSHGYAYGNQGGVYQQPQAQGYDNIPWEQDLGHGRQELPGRGN